MPLAARLAAITLALEKARLNAPLAAPRVRLLAACKMQPPERIEAAIAAGVADFGENRVQEAQAKWPALRQRYPGLRLHLIGPLQTNKVRDALALFDVIQTLDRPKLAGAIAKQREDCGTVESGENKRSALRLYVQVNTGEEPQKAGVSPREADDFLRYCLSDLALPVTGVMCVPPQGQPPAPHFALLRRIALRHGLQELSMGMSADFETAVRMSSTCVRIGTALFGERPKNLKP